MFIIQSGISSCRRNYSQHRINHPIKVYTPKPSLPPSPFLRLPSYIRNLQASPRDRSRSIPNGTLEEASPSTLHRLEERLGHSIRTLCIRMRMVSSHKQRIRARLAEPLVHIRRILSMIHKHGIAPQRLCHIPRITHKPSSIRILKATRLPRIIRRLRTYNYLGSLCNKLLARLRQVPIVRSHLDFLAVVGGIADFVSGTRAYGAPVVGAA